MSANRSLVPLRRVWPVALVAIWGALLLAGCGSGSVRVDSSEAYAGELAAAVTPIAGAGGTESARLQTRLIRALEADDLFASVIPLSSPGESNEAEVIIEPRLLGPAGRELRLSVQARRKTTGAVELSQTYRGSVDDVVAELSRDLRRRFGG